jgi:hypothetical protein
VVRNYLEARETNQACSKSEEEYVVIETNEKNEIGTLEITLVWLNILQYLPHSLM